jgi:hypothetical protein
VAALIEAAELECPRLEGGDRAAGTAQKAASAALNVAVTLAELEKALERCKAGTAPGEDGGRAAVRGVPAPTGRGKGVAGGGLLGSHAYSQRPGGLEEGGGGHAA